MEANGMKNNGADMILDEKAEDLALKAMLVQSTDKIMQDAATLALKIKQVIPPVR